MKRFTTAAVITIISALCITMSSQKPYDFTRLHDELQNYIAGKDAKIGVAVIIDGNDTVEVNGGEEFPMLSVYKFPQALAIADYCRRSNIAFDDTISIAASEIRTDTYSPLRDKYGVKNLRLPVSELLAYSLQLSDNNACDILFRLSEGTGTTDSTLRASGFHDIKVRYTEDEMHRDVALCYMNSSTPTAMAMLLDRFNTELRDKTPEYTRIAYLMETCATGTDRLMAPLKHDVDTALLTVGHKTGTGDKNSQGRIIGINDVGYVNFPDGYRYSIAVFVSDSAHDFTETSSIIARISEMVYSAIKKSRAADKQ